MIVPIQNFINDNSASKGDHASTLGDLYDQNTAYILW